jgi:uncharacterized cysteine cluster protein YcgN (CxxCxxCC family)
MNSNFWKEKSLHEMNDEEWESICDGCGKCCLIKLSDDDTNRMCYTDVACRCSNYPNRHDFVPECLEIRDNFDYLMGNNIMPVTCAYRLLNEGKELYDWHYLISGDRNSVHEANVSVKDKVKNETGDEILITHIIDWTDYGDGSYSPPKEN